MKSLSIIVVVIIGILAFGYWHAISHASFYVSLNVAGEADYRTIPAPEAKIQFLDSKGRVLANGIRDPQYNFVRLIHPKEGDCQEVEKMAAFSKDAKTAWQECFEHQSTWIAKWIKYVEMVNVTYGNCQIRSRPITIAQSNSDWYLWWIPHPHIGGKPYSDYSSTVMVNEEDCVETQSNGMERDL
ncbi:MAG: hypothetical protein ACR2QI_02350 [Woeseiaceae bacterium]